jgi:hypothetical protein
MKCDDCKRDLPDSDHFTQINPEGGYGRPRFLACDDCMKSGRWDGWKERHWPNWPEPRTPAAR